ncbi:MAG: hypothetical protein AB7P52_17660 [Alphaproteobacteria bacterium]
MSEARALVPTVEVPAPEPEPLLRSAQSVPPPATPVRPPRYFWTTREIATLREIYPTGGIQAAMAALPGRSAQAIYMRASKLGIASSIAPQGQRRRHQSSEAIDALIRRTYWARPQKGSINRLAASLGKPRWWVTQRARRLGCIVPRFKELPWSAEEDALLDTIAHRRPESIAGTFRRRGYNRSPSGIASRIKRLKISTVDAGHYTARQLSIAFGVDDKTVLGWIVRGWLQARRRGTARTPQQGGDQWWVSRRQVRTFVIENVGQVDFRKVDKWWLVDLLTDPALAGRPPKQSEEETDG